MKYLIIGFDDGTVYDRKAVELLNKYRINGTFFINSGTLGEPGFLDRDELEDLFKYHEVASHTLGHPKLRELTHEGIKYQILEDIENLETFTKQKVIGFAYPFGDYTKKVKDMVKECGISYARTVKRAKDYKKPKDFLEWDPTMHFTGMAYNTDDFERVKKGFRFLLDKFDEFLDDYNSEVFQVWLHTWEFKNDLEKWDMFEQFLRLVSFEDDVKTITARDYYKRVSK